MQSDRLKAGAATLSLAYNVAATIFKFAAAALTGSVSLLSEAVHSATDVVASFIAFLSVRAASAPPDEDHPYGHGKIENIAGLIESILLLLIVVYIVLVAIRRLMTGAEPQNLDIGLVVMFFSAITSCFVAIRVRRVAQETGSMALQSNSQHLMVDFWTSVGVLLALGVTRFTGWAAADAVFAIVFAVWIAYGATRLCTQAIHELIDRRLPDEEIARVRAILEATEGAMGYHNLRTRHSGNVHYIDVHVVVPNQWSVVQAHDLADRIEKRIAETLPPAHVVVHIDPFDPKKLGQTTDT
jgi:cation diffusion facilitator family transporter